MCARLTGTGAGEKRRILRKKKEYENFGSEEPHISDFVTKIKDGE